MGNNKLINLFKQRPFLIECFAASNLAFLVLDIYVAHSVNQFHHWSEWIPFYFALFGSAFLLIQLFMNTELAQNKGLRLTGFIVAALGIVIGIAGLVLHLESNFFQAQTLKALIYAAPFAAPLAFTGLGFLLLLNRMVDTSSTEWAKWILMLSLGGFVGNFLLSVADHAQNGFFYATEWIPVVTSAFAIGALTMAILAPLDQKLYRYAKMVLWLQIITGLAGAVFHIWPLFSQPTDDLFSSIIYGAPVFAPFLFIDLAILAAIGLWDLHEKTKESQLATA